MNNKMSKEKSGGTITVAVRSVLRHTDLLTVQYKLCMASRYWVLIKFGPVKL